MLIARIQYCDTMKNRTVVVIALCFTFALVSYSNPLSYAINSTPNYGQTQTYIFGCPIYGTCFTPCKTTVTIGNTVTWINKDTREHMISSGSGQSGPDGWFSSPVIFPHGVFSHKFDRKGVFVYFDNMHPYAQGVVIVDSSINSDFVKLQKSYFSDWWCTK